MIQFGFKAAMIKDDCAVTIWLSRFLQKNIFIQNAFLSFVKYSNPIGIKSK